MLCEGSPLFLYTAWGPVAPTGMYQGALRLTRARRADRRADPRADRRGPAGVACSLTLITFCDFWGPNIWGGCGAGGTQERSTGTSKSSQNVNHSQKSSHPSRL